MPLNLNGYSMVQMHYEIKINKKKCTYAYTNFIFKMNAND